MATKKREREKKRTQANQLKQRGQRPVEGEVEREKIRVYLLPSLHTDIHAYRLETHRLSSV